jgi:hypothetical protein
MYTGSLVCVGRVIRFPSIFVSPVGAKLDLPVLSRSLHVAQGTKRGLPRYTSP